MATSGDDCYFFYYSSCSKGQSCPFRHCEAALGNEMVCSLWKEGRCYRQVCAYRHMEIEKDRSSIPCYWESQPGGCRKPHCVFQHIRDQDIVGTISSGTTAPIIPAGPTPVIVTKVAEPVTPSAAGLVNKILDAEVETHSPTVEPVVFNPFEEESDQESTCSTPQKYQPVTVDRPKVIKTKKNTTDGTESLNFGVRSLEEIRKEKIARSLEQVDFYGAKEQENTGDNSSAVESFSIAKLRQQKAEREAREVAQKAARVANRGRRTGVVRTQVAASPVEPPSGGGRRFIVTEDGAYNVVYMLQGKRPRKRRPASVGPAVLKRPDAADENMARTPSPVQLGIKSLSQIQKEKSESTQVEQETKENNDSSVGGIKIKSLEEIRREKALKSMQRMQGRNDAQPPRKTVQVDKPARKVPAASVEVRPIIRKIRLGPSGSSLDNFKVKPLTCPKDDVKPAERSPSPEIVIKSLADLRREKPKPISAEASKESKPVEKVVPVKRKLRQQQQVYQPPGVKSRLGKPEGSSILNRLGRNKPEAKEESSGPDVFSRLGGGKPAAKVARMEREKEEGKKEEEKEEKKDRETSPAKAPMPMRKINSIWSKRKEENNTNKKDARGGTVRTYAEMLREKKLKRDEERGKSVESSSNDSVSKRSGPSPISFGNKLGSDSPAKKRKFTPVVFDLKTTDQKSQDSVESQGTSKRRYVPIVFDLKKDEKEGEGDRGEPASKKITLARSDLEEREETGTAALSFKPQGVTLPSIPKRKITLARATVQQSKTAAPAIPQKDTAALPAGDGSALVPGVSQTAQKTMTSPHKLMTSPTRISVTSPTQKSVTSSPQKSVTSHTEKFVLPTSKSLTTESNHEVSASVRVPAQSAAVVQPSVVPEKKPVSARRLSIRRRSSQASDTKAAASESSIGDGAAENSGGETQSEKSRATSDNFDDALDLLLGDDEDEGLLGLDDDPTNDDDLLLEMEELLA